MTPCRFYFGCYIDTLCGRTLRNRMSGAAARHILKNALTDEIDSRHVYMKGIDHSYYYEGYTAFRAEEL